VGKIASRRGKKIKRRRTKKITKTKRKTKKVNRTISRTRKIKRERKRIKSTIKQ
jgi:hypothetical protein